MKKKRRNKTNTEGMIKAIVWCVANRNIKCVSDISHDTGLDRGGVTRYTELLSDIGVLIPYYRRKITYYTVNPDIQRYLEKEGEKFIKEMVNNQK